jgi:hypothetical protein
MKQHLSEEIIDNSNSDTSSSINKSGPVIQWIIEKQWGINHIFLNTFEEVN